MDVAQRCAAQTDGRGHIRQAAFHQHHIRRVNGHVGACADGDADVGAGQGGGVVDAIAHHDDLALALQAADDALLAVGKDSRNDLIHTGFGANGSGGALVVTGQHHHMQTHVPQLLNGAGAVLLDGVRHGDDAAERAVLRKEQRRFAFLRKRVTQRLRFSGHRQLLRKKPAAAAHQHRAVQHAAQPVAGQRLKLLHPGGGQPVRRGPLLNRPGQRMLAFLFQRKRSGQQFLFADAGSGQNVGDLRRALRDGAGLVQRHDAGLAGLLQRYCRFEQDAVFRAHAVAHHDGHGGGKSQRAGAADDQHRNAPRQRKTGALSRQQPDNDRDGRNAHDGGHEHAGDPVRHLGDGGLGGGGVADHLNDLRQRGVLAHAGGLAAQESGLVQRSGGNGAAGGLVHRDALPGEAGFIHRAGALQNGSVHGDVLAGTHHKHIAFGHLLQRNGHLRAVPQQRGGFGSQLHQPFQRIGGPALGAGLQHFAKGDERQDGGGGLKVKFVHIGHHSVHVAPHLRVRHGKQGKGAVPEGRRRAQRDQRVHVGRAVPQAFESADEKFLVDDHDNDGQQQLQKPHGHMIAVEKGGQRPAPHHVSH